VSALSKIYKYALLINNKLYKYYKDIKKVLKIFDEFYYFRG